LALRWACRSAFDDLACRSPFVVFMLRMVTTGAHPARIADFTGAYRVPGSDTLREPGRNQ
jgi:hypothetical protein